MPAKGYKKPNGRAERLHLSFTKQEIVEMRALAELYCEGNLTAWIVCRATSDTQEEFKRRLKAWEEKRRDMRRRKLVKAGALPAPSVSSKKKASESFSAAFLPRGLHGRRHEARR